MSRPQPFIHEVSGTHIPPLGRDVSQDGRVPALDGLRGIAILLVMLYHFTFYGGMQPATLVDASYYQLAASGWVGVDLFFVLSGFLITGILYDTKESVYFFRNFYARRFVRIFPLYYGTLFFFFIVLPHLASLGQEYRSLIQQQAWYWTYLVNFLIAFRDWSPFGIIEHFWSLAVEEQFYLFWPIVVFLLRRQKLMLLCAVCLLASFVVRVGLVRMGYPTAANVLTLARVDSLAVGSFLALAARGPNGLSRLYAWARPVLIVTLVALLRIFILRHGLSSDDREMQTIGYTLLALQFGAILTLSVQRRSGTALASPVLQFFGRYSYALYVFHQPIVFYLKDHVLSVKTFPAWLGLQLPGQILFILIATAISVVFALLSWYLYEQPFLRLKRLFPYEYRRIAAQTVPEPG